MPRFPYVFCCANVAALEAHARNKTTTENVFLLPVPFKWHVFGVAIKFAGFYSRLLGPFSVSGNVCLKCVDETLKKVFSPLKG